MGYTIIKKADHQFVVRSEDQDILTCRSRREAARFVADANCLMHPAFAAAGRDDTDEAGAPDVRQAAEIKE